MASYAAKRTTMSQYVSLSTRFAAIAWMLAAGAVGAAETAEDTADNALQEITV